MGRISRAREREREGGSACERSAEALDACNRIESILSNNMQSLHTYCSLWQH